MFGRRGSTTKSRASAGGWLDAPARTRARSRRRSELNPMAAFTASCEQCRRVRVSVRTRPAPQTFAPSRLACPRLTRARSHEPPAVELLKPGTPDLLQAASDVVGEDVERM